MREQNNDENVAGRGLVIIARDTTGVVISRLTCTRSSIVVSAMKSARSVLILKKGAVRVEVHYEETPTSTYPGKPVATISTDDPVQMRNPTSS